MILKSITITDERPKAFKDREEINYVELRFTNMEFMTWGSTAIVSQFQVPKDYKDLGDILWHMFTSIIPIDPKSPFIVSVRKELIEKNNLILDAGVYKDEMNKSEVEQEYVEWELALYKKQKHGRIK